MKRHYLIIIFFIALIILGLSIGLKLLLGYEERQYISLEKEKIQSQIYNLSNELSYYIGSIRSDIRLSASYVENINKSQPIEEVLKSLFGIIDDSLFNILNVAYLDDSGTIQSIYPETFKNEIGNNISFRNYFIKASRTGKLEISEPLSNYRPKKNRRKV